ncbi:hypothetical protein [Pseudomonas knackmussii]|uniref:hypothetical protein n=1 Tax=Pseudomonas knackmussii TaxID=65741 RepID=UPI001363DE7C|nr:hypothetical protein [Pseudomonas knackmussii]
MQSQPHEQPRAAYPAAIVLDSLLPGDRMPLALLERGLRLEIPPISGAFPGETINVQVDGKDVLTNLPADPSAAQEVTVPLAPWLAGGKHELTYSHAADISIPTVVFLDRVAPHQGQVPPALPLPNDIAIAGVTAGYLQANNDQLLLNVPGYSGMEAGQSVRLVWAQTLKLLPVTVTEADVQAGQITVTIPGYLIRLTGNGEHDLFYHLTNSTGIDGHASYLTKVSVNLGEAPSGMLPPVFVEANARNYLLYAVVIDGAEVHVPPYEGMALGDEVILTWQGFRELDWTVFAPETTYSSEPKVVDAQALSEGLTFTLPWDPCFEPLNEEPDYFASGLGRYQVRGNQGVLLSPITAVKIDFLDLRAR